MPDLSGWRSTIERAGILRFENDKRAATRSACACDGSHDELRKFHLTGEAPALVDFNPQIVCVARGAVSSHEQKRFRSGARDRLGKTQGAVQEVFPRRIALFLFRGAELRDRHLRQKTRQAQRRQAAIPRGQLEEKQPQRDDRGLPGRSDGGDELRLVQCGQQLRFFRGPAAAVASAKRFELTCDGVGQSPRAVLQLAEIGRFARQPPKPPMRLVQPGGSHRRQMYSSPRGSVRKKGARPKWAVVLRGLTSRTLNANRLVRSAWAGRRSMCANASQS